MKNIIWIIVALATMISGCAAHRFSSIEIEEAYSEERRAWPYSCSDFNFEAAEILHEDCSPASRLGRPYGSEYQRFCEVVERNYQVCR